jgi:hypothetical protein
VGLPEYLVKREYLRLDEEEKEYYTKATLEGESSYSAKDIDSRSRTYTVNAISYFNRGLLRLQLNQKESGCLDLSNAGELGYAKAYDVINTHCQ